MSPLLLAQAAAETAPAAPPNAGAGGATIHPLVMAAIIFGVFYFLWFRPQSQERKKRQELLAKIKKNDRVYTSGGIYGTVMSVKDDEVTLRVDEDTNTRIRVMRWAILGSEADTPEAKKQEMTQSGKA